MATGTTTRQMQKAPLGAIYVWPNANLGYPQKTGSGPRPHRPRDQIARLVNCKKCAGIPTPFRRD